MLAERTGRPTVHRSKAERYERLMQHCVKDRLFVAPSNDKSLSSVNSFDPSWMCLFYTEMANKTHFDYESRVQIQKKRDENFVRETESSSFLLKSCMSQAADLVSSWYCLVI